MNPSHFRRSGRSALALEVRFRAGSALTQSGTAIDLGMGGAFIGTATPPDPGTRVRLELATPATWQPLELPGVVRWVRSGRTGEAPGFGLKFEALSEAKAHALYELLQTSELSDSAW
jgi:uncharacterized protein (TIGR02266 family)